MYLYVPIYEVSVNRGRDSVEPQSRQHRREMRGYLPTACKMTVYLVLSLQSTAFDCPAVQ